MPNTKSAAKRLITNEKRALRNRVRKSRVKTAKKKFLEALGSNDLAAAEAALSVCFATLDKAAKRGAVSKNKVARDKSRLSLKLSALRKTA
jgi:small subunit ribosomal protein S20